MNAPMVYDAKGTVLAPGDRVDGDDGVLGVVTCIDWHEGGLCVDVQYDNGDEERWPTSRDTQGNWPTGTHTCHDVEVLSIGGGYHDG